MGRISGLTAFTYTLLAFWLCFFIWDRWRPSMLLVGNVTIDSFPAMGKSKQLPGGALRVQQYFRGGCIHAFVCPYLAVHACVKVTVSRKLALSFIP
jgi:hypothetical protein